MTRIVFLTVILTSGILAFVQAGPVPKNQEGKDEPAKSNEFAVDNFGNELEETWINVKNVMEKNYKELLDDPSVSRPFLNTINEFIEEINKVNEEIINTAREHLDNVIKAENNTNNVKDYVSESWNAFIDKLWGQYEKSMENPKVQAIIREVENAMRSSKDILEGVIDTTREQIDAQRSEKLDLVVEFEDNDLRMKEAWKKLKNQIKEKYYKLINNPKVKEIASNIDKVIDKSEESLKNIINTFGKEMVRDSKSYSLEDTQEPQVASFKERIKEVWKDMRNNLKEKTKAIWSDPKVKEVVQKREEEVEQNKKALKNITENARNEIDGISKEAEKLKANADATNWKEKVQETWNDFKKKILEKSEEMKKNPEVKKTIEATDKAIENAKGNVKEVIGTVHKSIESISKETDEIAENTDTRSAKEKIEKAWNDFKTVITDKIDEIIRDPKTKVLLDKSERAINEIQENIKNIIKSIRKAADDSTKDTDENSAKSAAATYVRNVKEAWNIFKKKIVMTYKNVWEKEKVKTAIDDGDRVLLKVEDSAQDVVNSIRKELENSNIKKSL